MILVNNIYAQEITNLDDFQLIGKKNFLHDHETFDIDGNLNVVIEIPSGTNEKWEVSEDGSKLELEFINGLPRIINYIGYPFSYGFIPKTLSDTKGGGDGDAVDIIVLGQKKIKRGEVIPVKIIGMYLMTEGDKIDNKVITVQIGSKFEKVNSLKILNTSYPGILEIIKIWFNNYKGSTPISNGFVSRRSAKDFIEQAKNYYDKNKSKN